MLLTYGMRTHIYKHLYDVTIEALEVTNKLRLTTTSMLTTFNAGRVESTTSNVMSGNHSSSAFRVRAAEVLTFPFISIVVLLGDQETL